MGRVVKTTFMIALVAIGCRSEAPDSASAISAPLGSILAVGDTGHPWGALPWLFEGQWAVAAAMEREHARSPVDGVVLLGDNFYPTGLIAKELLSRIVENVARPYCAFIDPSPELVRELGKDCAVLGVRPPRLLAVIGNHDLVDPGSFSLQRTEVPRYVRNWDMPKGDGPEIREMPGGLSLILIDSSGPWVQADRRALASALERASGPFRVIIGHRPPIAGHPQLTAMVAGAAADADRIVHAYLAGHLHVLGAIRGEWPAPSVTVIAGSGSRARRQDTSEYRIEGADLILETLGFVRLDVVLVEGETRLRIGLYATPSSAALSFLGSRRVESYDVTQAGEVERLNRGD